MNKKNDGLLGGLLLFTGAIIGSAITLLVKENRPMMAGLVLDKVKLQLNSLGTIEGSWIDYDSIEYDLFEDEPLVYIGGLTIENQGQVQLVQFAADVYTGEVIDYYLVDQD